MSMDFQKLWRLDRDGTVMGPALDIGPTSQDVRYHLPILVPGCGELGMIWIEENEQHPIPGSWDNWYDVLFDVLPSGA